MSKTRNRRPPDDNPSRRSLVDLTAAVKQAVEDGLLEAPVSPVVSLVEHARSEPSRRPDRVAETPERIDVPKQAPVPTHALAPAAPSKKQASRESEIVPSASAAEMMVQIAKDYQSGVLDSIKAGLNAALDQAKDFVETESRGAVADVAQDHGLKALGAATAAFRAATLQLMQANAAMTIDYARDLAGTRSAAEFVELTATQARKSCELMLKQADAVKSLAQAVAKDRTED